MHHCSRFLGHTLIYPGSTQWSTPKGLSIRYPTELQTEKINEVANLTVYEIMVAEDTLDLCVEMMKLPCLHGGFLEEKIYFDRKWHVLFKNPIRVESVWSQW
jgi:hypothetical protein